MNSRERIRTIISGKAPDRGGLWLGNSRSTEGNPHPDSWPGLHAYFGTQSAEELQCKLGDDFRWM